ncbi:MAG: tetratricopeptide repeat protein [Bryobacteraceae bacterium]
MKLAFLLLLAAIEGVSQAPEPGEALYQAGDFAKARQVLEKDIASDKAPAKAHFWLAYTYLAIGERDRAIAQFEAYLHDNPADEDALYALGKTYAQLAEMSLERIFQLDAESARAYQMRGIRFELEKSWKEAIQAYEHAIQLDPKIRGLYSSIGRIELRERGNRPAAEAAYGNELPALTGKRKTDRESGMLLMEAGKPRDSLPFLLRWRAAEPTSPDAHYYLGEAFTDLKVGTIRRLKEVNPRSYRLHQILAEDYASVHDRADAIAEYRQVIAMQPRVPGVHYELAKLLSDTSIEEAVTLLKTELLIDPQHYPAKGLLGRIYVALHQPDAAVPLLEEALAAKPDALEPRQALGQAWVAKRNFPKALECYRAVAERNPADEQIHFLLAQAYTAMGRPDEAARERALHREVLREVLKKAATR